MTIVFRISVLATALFSSASGARLQPAPDVVAFTQVAVVNPAGSATLPDRTVVVAGDRIHAVVLNGRLLDRKALDSESSGSIGAEPLARFPARDLSTSGVNSFCRGRREAVGDWWTCRRGR